MPGLVFNLLIHLHEEEVSFSGPAPQQQLVHLKVSRGDFSQIGLRVYVSIADKEIGGSIQVKVRNLHAPTQ